MTDRKTTSGYAVEITATKSLKRSLFFPCDPDDPASLIDAAAKIEAAKSALAAEGYEVKAKQKLRLRADPAQLPLPQTATEDGGDPAAGDPDFAEIEETAPAEQPVGHGRLANGDPDMPSALRRGKQAAE